MSWSEYSKLSYWKCSNKGVSKLIGILLDNDVMHPTEFISNTLPYHMPIFNRFSTLGIGGFEEVSSLLFCEVTLMSLVTAWMLGEQSLLET